MTDEICERCILPGLEIPAPMTDGICERFILPGLVSPAP